MFTAKLVLVLTNSNCIDWLFISSARARAHTHTHTHTHTLLSSSSAAPVAHMRRESTSVFWELLQCALCTQALNNYHHLLLHFVETCLLFTSDSMWLCISRWGGRRRTEPRMCKSGSQPFTFQGLPLTLIVYKWNQMDPSGSIWFHLYTVRELREDRM